MGKGKVQNDCVFQQKSLLDTDPGFCEGNHKRLSLICSLSTLIPDTPLLCWDDRPGSAGWMNQLDFYRLGGNDCSLCHLCWLTMRPRTLNCTYSRTQQCQNTHNLRTLNWSHQITLSHIFAAYLYVFSLNLQ